MKTTMPRGKLIAALRWACVLPAAVLGGFIAQFIVGAAVRIAGGWGSLGDSNVLRLLLGYLLPKAVFVLAGAKMAPRNQPATAIVLAILGVCVSLMIHVVGQRLAGNHVGFVNYTHFVAQSAGLLGGAAGIVWQDWRKCGRTRASDT